MLVRQLVMQKKENMKYKDEIEEYKQIIEEKQQDEEPVDIHKFANEAEKEKQVPI